MFTLSSLVQKAQAIIDANAPPLALTSDRKPDKAALFRHQFRLPDSQSPLHEITAELTLPGKLGKGSDRGGGGGNHYVGRLHLSEQFLCFSTQNSTFVTTATTSASSTFTGQTHGAGPFGNGFTLPLCAVRRVERLHSENYTFALSISTWNGLPSPSETNSKALNSQGGKTAPPAPKLTIQLAGSRTQCERFCDGLKKGLRDGMREVEGMRKVVGECYSEYMLASEARRRERARKDKEREEKRSTGETVEKEVEAEEEPKPPDAGLGTVFRYPGDPRKLRDKGKMRLWYEYLRENGRNATLIRQPDLPRLIRIGLPNRMRGEMWCLSSGAFYLQLQQPKLYAETLLKYDGQLSLAIEEIEKDLNRSLPEYPGFQSEQGIGRLRRVLTAYSWTNTDVGYCQAMNIVVAALLMYACHSGISIYQANLPRYLSETQAFYLLSILCDRLLPGYYSTTMYGTLLDQKVFESLVEKTLPILSEHLTKADVQLSVVSLPWFLSLYINSMPLIFAFRVLDVFFLEGPKVLFQVGLAILRINGEELLDTTDDGTFISVLKSYFARLGESAHPKSENPKLRAVTNFQALMVVAFKEFSGITQNTISEQRAKHKDAVLANIESFAKRTSIRNLGPDSKKLSTSDLGFLYDRFYGVLYERQQRLQMIQEENERKAKAAKARASEVVTGIPSNGPEMGRVGLGPSPTQMDYDAFREFLAGVTRWAITDSPSSPTKDLSPEKHSFGSTFRGRSMSVMSVMSLSPWGQGPEPAEHDFMQRLYRSWNADSAEALSLQNVVSGLARVKGSRDIMSNISYFFELYDDNKDGKIDREGILNISEALLFLSRRGLSEGQSPSRSINSSQVDLAIGGSTIRRENKDEQFLSSISAFIRRCFEYAEPDPTAAPDAESNGDFSIGEDDDDDDDLLDFSDKPAKAPPAPAEPSTPLKSPHSERQFSFGQTTPNKHASANAALDPNHPLHLTLPSFRMLVLADEALESFFDSGFPNSFHLADAPLPSSTVTSSSSLTTFASAGIPAKPIISPGGPGAGVVAPGKGLRGMLDNIVTDGMRVAAEVRRRMDDAQRELDRSGSGSGGGGSAGGARGATEQDDEDEEDLDGRDLLEGADAEAGGAGAELAGPRQSAPAKAVAAAAAAAMPSLLDDQQVGGKGKGEEVLKDTMFER